ncbi:MAG: helix-turn-helix domain-containing protein [Marinomonas sp.]
MSEEELAVAPETDIAPQGAAERLRHARQAKGMSIEQVAAKTRITNRHLELIEEGKFGSLPGRTYAIGFAKNYARVVGENEEEIAAGVREEMAMVMPETGMVDRSADFEPGDPGKVPGAGLTWLSIFAVIALGAGAYMFYSTYYGSGASPGSLVDEATAALAGSDEGDGDAEGGASAAAASDGPVIFTAQEDGIWVRFYDGASNVLLEKQMAKGEAWTVPAEAVDPQIRTGRPDAFAITIGGQSVPVIDPEPRVVSDIMISAEALLARGTEEPAAEESEQPAT